MRVCVRERERERERGVCVKCICVLVFLNEAHKPGIQVLHSEQQYTTSTITGHVYVHVYTGVLKPGIETRHGVFYVFLNQAHKPGILHFTKF